MADFCKECFIKAFRPSQEDIEKIVLSDDDYLCEGCGRYKKVVDYIGDAPKPVKLLGIDELSKAHKPYIEASSIAHTFMLGLHIIVGISENTIHMKRGEDFVIGNIDNYNIGWRAWERRPSDKQRKETPWAPVVKSKGKGYGWDCEKMHEKHNCPYWESGEWRRCGC